MTYLEPVAGAPTPTQTAVIVPVAAAEPAVGDLRLRFDIAASWGVPAHVTVLYPFLEPDAVTPAVLNTLAAAVAPVPAFDCRFARSRWFGDEVLWLDPDPSEPFRRLTAAVWAAFPDHPPYGGLHADVVPHLTVAETSAADLPTVQGVEDQLRSRLPVVARIDHLLLIAGAEATDSWRVLATIPLHPRDGVTGG